jgi:hypothetical protein
MPIEDRCLKGKGTRIKETVLWKTEGKDKDRSERYNEEQVNRGGRAKLPCC